MKKNVVSLSACFVFLSLGTALAGPNELPQKVIRLIPAAEAEGQVHVFGTTLNPRQKRVMNRSFNNFYGTNIKVILTGGLHSSKSSEVAMAARAGVPTGIDIMWTGQIKPLLDANALVKIDWVEELGVEPALTMGAYGLRTHDGHLSMVTVNTNLVPPETEPRSYWDLLDPKWTNLLAIPRSPFPWVFLSYAMGEDQVADLLTQLMKKQNPKRLPRYADIRTRVIGGEFPVTIGTDAFTPMALGAPVRHPDMDILVLASTGAFILADSPHKTVAKLWGYWAISDEGQQVLEQVRAYSLSTSPGTALYNYANGRKTYHVPLDWRLEHNDRLVEKYLAIMKIR